MAESRKVNASVANDFNDLARCKVVVLVVSKVVLERTGEFSYKFPHKLEMY